MLLFFFRCHYLDPSSDSHSAYTSSLFHFPTNINPTIIRPLCQLATQIAIAKLFNHLNLSSLFFSVFGWWHGHLSLSFFSFCHSWSYPNPAECTK